MAFADLAQIVGALLVLIPFTALQLGRTSAETMWYLVLNLLGSTLLAVLAVTHQQWGFLLLEGVWALVAGYGLLRQLRGGAGAGGVSGHAAQA